MVALTLIIASVAVVNRVDDYFYQQTKVDLSARATTVLETVVGNLAKFVPGHTFVVLPDNTIDPVRGAVFEDAENLKLLSDLVAQANVQVSLGLPTQDSSGKISIVPAANGTFSAPRTALPRPGQAPDPSRRRPPSRSRTRA